MTRTVTRHARELTAQELKCVYRMLNERISCNVIAERLQLPVMVVLKIRREYLNSR